MDCDPSEKKPRERGGERRRRNFCLAVLWLCVWPAVPGRAEMPWKEAGLSERQAAAHLLNRFTYGPRPGDVSRVVRMGLDNWLDWQPQGDAPGAAASAVLARLDSVPLTPEEVAESYPEHSTLLAEAIAEGVVTREEYNGALGQSRRRSARQELQRFALSQGYRPPEEVLAELRAQKLYLAVYSLSQLTEVLTDFWFNHFNVSAADPQCRPYVLSYERSAIRPRVLGTFGELLAATARHPAMLIYLDNAHSQAEPGVQTRYELEMEDLGSFSPAESLTLRQRLARTLKWRPPGMSELERRRYLGLNENYARELLELHTLGVDGGYGQDDVIEVARAFTGWGLLPKPARQREILLEAAEEADFGFVIDGEFLFRADRHDAEPKRILGVPLPAGRGIEDGEEVLDLLVAHPSTALHLARKIAVRFVSDRPSEQLVERLTRAWELSGNSLREVIRTLVSSPEFWIEGRKHSKLKSPFELVASSLRALDAEIDDPAALLRWITDLGQPLYTCAPPTGYPDRPETWASAGSLLARVNFAEKLARGRIDGVSYGLLGLVGGRFLSSPTEAVQAYLPLVLAERQLGEMLAAAATAPAPERPAEGVAGSPDALSDGERLRRAERYAWYALSLLLGSPEFQQR